MGEVAEMILDGTLCQSCGVFIGEGEGFPRECAYCRRAGKAAGKVACPVCKKKVKGLNDHIRDAHPGHTEREKATHETATRDMLESARADLEMLREALGVPAEPHQSLIERMVEAAQAKRGAVPEWWKPMPVNGSYELARAFREAEAAALLSGHDHIDAFHCGYRALIAAAPAPACTAPAPADGDDIMGGAA